MRVFSFRLLVALAAIIFVHLSACANNNGSLQGRIENKLDNPDKENLQIGTAHYNSFSKGFDEAWPFGPYSD
jgi:hypothetical protein